MKVTKQKFKLNTSGYSFKIKHGDRRMKMYLKLNKEETEQWNTVKEAVLGGMKTDEGQFAKFIFFKGLGSFMDEVAQSVEKLSEEEQKKILEEHAQEVEAAQDKEVEVEVATIEKDSNEDSNEADL